MASLGTLTVSTETAKRPSPQHSWANFKASGSPRGRPRRRRIAPVHADQSFGDEIVHEIKRFIVAGT